MIGAAEGAEKLSSEELLSLAKLLLVAGNETTTKLIGLMMNQLLSNPPALRELGEAPGLIPDAVEEDAPYRGAGLQPPPADDEAMRHRRTFPANRRARGLCSRSGKPRRPRLPQSDQVRHPAQDGATSRLRRRDPPVPRRPARPARDEARVRGAARACKGHRAHRTAATRNGLELPRIRVDAPPLRAPENARPCSGSSEGSESRKSRSPARSR